MDSQDGERPDVSSIKPVSSLRSRFENLNTAEPSRSLTPTPPPSKQGQLLPRPDWERARTSLDLPRQSGWNDSGGGTPKKEEVVKHSPKLQEAVPQRQNASGRASHPRPLSMGVWDTRATSPPAVTLQTPVSPPKPLWGETSKTSGFGSFRSSTPPLSDLPARKSTGPPAFAAPLSPRSATSPRAVSQIQEIETARKPAVPSPLANVKIPPPINRAKKPSTPTVPGFAAPPSGAKQTPVSKEVSPFSTPPSSDESPGRQSADTAPVVPMLTKPTKQSSWPKETSYFQQPPVHQAVESHRRGSESAAVQRQVQDRSRTRSIGTRRDHDESDLPDKRPQLPTRQNESPAKAGGLLAPETPRRSLDSRRQRSPSPAPPRPSEESKRGLRKSIETRRPEVSELLSAPKSSTTTNGPSSLDHVQASNSTVRSIPARQAIASSSSSRVQASLPHAHETSSIEQAQSFSTDFPIAMKSNRRPPRAKYGVTQVYPGSDTRIIDLCGDYVCVAGNYTQAWDLRSGRMIFNQDYSEESHVKVTSFAFRPGANTDEEGQFVWLGFNYGEIQEVDLKLKHVVRAKYGVHGHRAVVSMHRYKNSLLSIDDEGKLYLWPAGERGVPSLDETPQSFRVSRGHTCSMVVKGKLWLAAGRQVRVYDPMSPENFHVTVNPLVQPGVAEISAGAFLSGNLDRVYFGHADGKISIYSSSHVQCIAVVNVSNYRITALAGAGHYLWAGFSTGRVYVYDTTPAPWLIKKEWLAHQGPIVKLITDRSSVWKTGHLQIASLGLDKTIRVWDGFLEDDWLESDFQDRDIEYCEFREIKTVIVTWNAGASTPQSLRFEKQDTDFFRAMVQPEDPPDIIVFGFQELVDLEDKKLTAKSFFKSSKRKESDHEHIGRQYRAWRDFLIKMLEEEVTIDSYHLVHTANMVGLFSCVFVKASQRNRVRGVSSGEVKRGLGGLHGNKGAIIVRFTLDDSSLCFTNCHLAAGQSHTSHRNDDVTAILEAEVLAREAELERRVDHFIGGGDGSMIMDHEICILNGDLNYRIDTMSRDSVVKAVKAGGLDKLLERDQLLVSKRRNATFRLRAFNEQPINFAPTYKYDVGTDKYDSSEKNRSPAWCDRILYRGVGRIKALDYKRHQVRVSDHRPVTATFKMRIKSIVPDEKQKVWKESQKRLEEMRLNLANETNLDYLVNTLGVEQSEASRLIRQ